MKKVTDDKRFDNTDDLVSDESEQSREYAVGFMDVTDGILINIISNAVKYTASGGKT